MPVELEITELNDYQKAKEFIDSQKYHVTLNMLKKVGIRKKIAFRVLRSHPNTMLCKPLDYGSNQNKNEKLYKKVTNEALVKLCNEELTNMKKTKSINDSNIESYIKSGLVQYMMEKYNIALDYSIIKLK
jgi:hypothetical protein